MKTLSFLQFGDVHYPSSVKQLAVDRKDGRFSTTLAAQATPNPLRSAIAAAVRLAQSRDDLRGIAITGDLTDHGLTEPYKECVDLLRESFSHLPVWQSGQVFVVPGNHDLQRENRTDKFGEFADAWEPEGWLTAGGPRWARVATDGAPASVACLNSSMGCGEWWGFPEEIKDDLIALLEDYMEKAGLEQSFPLIGEYLDTPAFRSEDIEEFIEKVRRENNRLVTVLLSHHGLLPQALNRIALYTEVLNGGYFRTRLLTLTSPVIYLHGHIHTDPVEVIRSPKVPGQVVSVSAPLFIKGFNLIVVQVSPEGLPIGVEIIEYRNPGHGGFDPLHQHRHRFLSPDQAQEVCDAEDAELLNLLSQRFMRFADLSATAASEGLPTDNDLAERLEKLDWLSLVEIKNLSSHSHKHWQIRRIGPS